MRTNVQQNIAPSTNKCVNNFGNKFKNNGEINIKVGNNDTHNTMAQL